MMGTVECADGVDVRLLSSSAHPVVGRQEFSAPQVPSMCAHWHA